MPYINKINVGGVLYDVQDLEASTAVPQIKQMISNVESSPATAAHAAGSYLIYNNTLYRASADIAVGDALTVGTNIAAVSGGLAGDVADLKSALDFGFEIGKNLLNPNKMEVGLIGGSNGNIDATSTGYKTSDFIPISNGQSIVCGRIVRRFLAYDSSKSPITASYQKEQQTNYIYTATADGYIRASYANSYIGVDAQIEYGDTNTAYEPYCCYLTDNVRLGDRQIASIDDEIKANVANTVNLIDPDQYEDGIIDRNNGTISASGSGANYKTTDFIPVTAGQKIAFSPRIRKMLAYTTAKAAIAASYMDTDTPNYVYTATANGYVRASFHVNYLAAAQAEYGETPTTYIPYGKRRLKTDIFVPSDSIEGATGASVLSGKKWCACGDSFTQGDFTGLQESEYKLQSGKYIGKNAVYPYIIGDRCNMEVTNLAVGGMTMCCIGGTRQNSFTYNEYYKQIPEDSDYITFKFGINDNNYSSPVGTIDNYEPDPDDTEEEAAQKIANAIQTFYGAWNVVLYWVTERFPTAKIGIIITNGITDNAGQVYLEATRNICKKWGIAYIDEVADETVPLLLRVKRTGLSETVYNRKLETFRVSETNLHPNVACHYYESTFIEEWLMRL